MSERPASTSRRRPRGVSCRAITFLLAGRGKISARASVRRAERSVSSSHLASDSFGREMRDDDEREVERVAFVYTTAHSRGLAGAAGRGAVLVVIGLSAPSMKWATTS